jgi:hypothetical protein
MFETFNHPRPDFARKDFAILQDGWTFRPDPENVGLQEEWQVPGKAAFTQPIHMPFGWDTPASGIHLPFMPVGWYHCTLHAPAEWRQARTVLTFGAVHYHTTVWVNGQRLGEHTGGYTPFAFDLSGALQNGQGELIVRVEAPEDKQAIPHGKQRSHPIDDYDGCSFSATSGIWQPVWLEARPATAISSIRLRPTDGLDGITVEALLDGPALQQAALTLQIEGQEALTLPVLGQQTIRTTLAVQNPRLWSPQDPHLYPVLATLSSPEGTDTVHTYTGLRKVEIHGKDVSLNGARVYLRGALEQGFWPEGIYTAPDEAALRKDVELALQAGFNLIRKHIKLEDPRWIYWADRLGLLVWEEPPCFSRFSQPAVRDFEAQFAPMVDRDGNHPCIIIWGIYNEEWGLDWKSAVDAERIAAVEHAYDLLKALDPSRPIVDDSGWWHIKSDIVDWHYYDENMRTWRETTAGLASDPKAWFNHLLAPDYLYPTQLWAPNTHERPTPVMNGEYGGGRSPEEHAWLFRWQTQDIRKHSAFCGYIYTELYDVEYEVVGLYNAQRVLKNLGFAPTMVNAETVIIFDMTPERIGCDLTVTGERFQVEVIISHTGPEPLEGFLSWGWEGEAPFGSAILQATPFVNTPRVALPMLVPQGFQKGRLVVRLVDRSGEERAYGFIEVEKGK